MKDHMELAITQARRSFEQGGVPIGSVLALGDEVLGAGHNQRIQKKSATRHAEIDALEAAGRLPAEIYRHATLYTTLSPCSMCAGAILLYGIPMVVIGENQNFLGEEVLLQSRGVIVEVLQDDRCIQLMRNFKSEFPQLWHEDIGE